VERERLVGAPQPLLRQRRVGGGLFTHGGTAYGSRTVVVVRKGVDPRPGCGEQVASLQHGHAAVGHSPVAGRLTHWARTENQHVRHGLLCKRTKYLEITSVCG